MARIKRSLAHIGHALRQKALWRLSLLTVLLLCVRLVFRHLGSSKRAFACLTVAFPDATFPKYVQRTLPGAPYGTLYAINPFSILVLVPLTTGVLASFDPFDCKQQCVVGRAVGCVHWVILHTDRHCCGLVSGGRQRALDGNRRKVGVLLSCLLARVLACAFC